MKSSWIVAPLVIALGACTPDPSELPDGGAENCTNGIDDDGDGYSDCIDADCTPDPACKPPPECRKQIDCFKGGQQYGDYTGTLAMPLCIDGKCVQPERNVEIGLTLFTQAYSGLPCQLGSINARFIKKKAVDGSAVTCTRVAGVAQGALEGDGDQIERTGLFNLQSWEALRISPPKACGTTVGSPIIDVATGSDFLVWAELWSEAISNDTHLPMGYRWGYVCVETGVNVDPILPTDTITRTVSVQMPPPQGWPPPPP